MNQRDHERAYPLGDNHAGRHSDRNSLADLKSGASVVNEDGTPPTPDNLTVHGTWDGNNCPACFDDDGDSTNQTPCADCGWFKCTVSGERYPPGFSAQTWGIATKRIRDLRTEFPTLWRERISFNVEMQGEEDEDGTIARSRLITFQLGKKFEDKYSPLLENDDICTFVIPNLQSTKSNPNPKYDIEKSADRIIHQYVKRIELKKKWRDEHKDCFDGGFNDPFDESMVEVIQTLCGCFYCNSPNPTKTCSSCHFAQYCNRSCQKESWKDCHKKECKVIADSMSRGPKPLALHHLELTGPDVLNIMMVKRTAKFLEELCRCNEATREILDLNICVINNMGLVCFQAWASFRDDTITSRTAPYALFRSLGPIDGGGAREMINEGCGDVPYSRKEDVVLLLKDFFTQAIENEISIKEMTCSRATLWLCEDEYKEKLKSPEVEERCCGIFHPPYGPKVIRPSANYAHFVDQVPNCHRLWELSSRSDLPR